MKKLLILNGPNLNLVGQRETSIYGDQDLLTFLQEVKDVYQGSCVIDQKQSNIEGELIDALQHAKAKGYHGVILNAGGYTHTSVALRDAIVAIDTPVVEVHISNPYAREDFRQVNLLSPVCKGLIAGFGLEGYVLAVDSFLE